ncbi:MAG: LysR substrate-binding domain-containing protein [Oxalicibacterium faecigallinarum]|uniref:Transcriptional regulator n=1 Tax=Oxalicibacterium faecigallinarum TaxID=573741 RepID=A0A8J3F3Y5_9BURK|nr:LysR substrate-binding domain-containing protein [Oxalicibacterium faecigallinarum]MDQ7970682.1 LysR substrate-binding domain-containing protein [Oxalicibacterium faecigallinarum]GGI21219.1 transcriptional regulator [Oxalicibacterium faecigallinarum]
MAIRLPPVHALSAFEAAARLGSFAVAAEELCITPSAFSHRIRLLEEFVGERLFLRDGRSVSLTEFGRRYLDVVRDALRSLADFPLPHRSSPTHPRVKITVPPTFARYLFLPNITEFTDANPDITIETFLSVPLYDMSLSETDVEVRFGVGNYPDLVTEKLFEEPVFPVASPEYAKQMGLEKPGDLKNATLLRSALEPWQPWFNAAGLDWPEPSMGLRIDDLGLLLEAVRHGYGVGLTRSHFARDMIRNGDLVPLFDVALTTPQHAYYLVYERGVRERPEVDAMLNWMMARFNTQRLS